MSSDDGAFAGLSIEWLDPVPLTDPGSEPSPAAVASLTAVFHVMTLVEQAGEPPGVSPEGWEAALSDAEAWVATEPGDAIAHYTHGLVLRRLERHQDALDAFDRALELDPGSDECLGERGHMLADLGRPADALASFDAAIAASDDPEDLCSMHTERAWLLHLLDRDADSLAASESALALAGDVPEQAAWILHFRTEAHEGSGDLEAAMADYTRILEIRPEWGTALYCRAATLSRTGRFSDALVDLAAARPPSMPTRASGPSRSGTTISPTSRLTRHPDPHTGRSSARGSERSCGSARRHARERAQRALCRDVVPRTWVRRAERSPRWSRVVHPT
ncbi:MAG: tetratricopeptide repeat protein [Chloroflexota bacterium]